MPTARLKDNWLVRDLVRQHRLTHGHPDWRTLLPDLDPAGTGPSAGRGRPKILLATVGGGYLAASWMESLLAAALAQRGAEPHVLLCDGALPACLECNSDWYPDAARFAREGPTRRHCDACFEPARDVFASLGVPVHRYSDLLGPDDHDRARATALATDPADVPGLALGGVRIGEHAQAGALRFAARAVLEPTLHSATILRRYVEAALLTKAAVERLLTEDDFDAVVCHHGIYVPQGVIGDVARGAGIRVVNWHVAGRKRCFIFSHDDTYHHTLRTEPNSAWEDMAWSDGMAAELDGYLRSRWTGPHDWIRFHREPVFGVDAIEAETGVDFGRPCVGMLTNVLWDAQVHYPANTFPSLIEWAVTTVRHFERRPDLQLLIRVHPAEVTGGLRSKQPFLAALAEAVPVLPPNVHVIPPESNLSTYAAMEQCDSVLIYATKTGVELAARGIPVVVTGDAWVRGKGVTTDPASPEEYARALDGLPLGQRLDPAVQERAQKYAYHYFFRRMIPLEFAELVDGIPGFRWKLAGRHDLDPGRSRGLDVICDGILDGDPFVYPAEAASVRVT